jgi:uncharacterized repeat protein (TIGR03809 family)
MANQTDVARGRETIARWCLLAEQRLDYLTELFETGRWRRFHSEVAFLDNIQEAKAAVETWRLLLSREALPNNTAVDNSWLETRKPLPPRANTIVRDDVRPALPRSLQILVEPPEPEPQVTAQPAPPELVELVQAAADGAPQRVPDLAAIRQRYPLLHNAL